VALGEARDALGMPRLVLDWNCSVADFETVRRSIGLLGEDLERAGAGRLECDAPALTAMMTCHGPHGGNHQGTTRMGTDPRTSVVDPNCRVHGVDNLYVAGPSVFPTACLGDPILTMVSLSLRLADHLRLLELHVVVPERVQSRLAELSLAPDPKTASVERSATSERLPSLVQRTA
jgi:choline dehydrogenase-like flavoprotein